MVDMSPSPTLAAHLAEAVGDPLELTRRLVDIPSVSGEEQAIADAVEGLLRGYDHLEVERFGHTVVARTRLGRADRVVLAGHLDTVPEHDNLPSRLEDGVLHGLGTCDMKGGVAVGLHLAATVAAPPRDVTYLFYECEEVEAERNGLTKLAATRPDLLEADFAVLMEPSNAVVEAGCQGTMRVDVTLTGQRAHSARSWMGSNAIHAAAPVLEKLAGFEARRPVIDGLEYREGLNAVAISGGVAGNVVPDTCVVAVNYRFAPDRSEEEALAFLTDLFAPHLVQVTDSSPGALPGLGVPAARDFVAAVGGEANPKFGWTDVARFSGLGVPAVNFGPGDPMYAHRQDEHVPVEHIARVAAQLRSWLTGEASGDGAGIDGAATDGAAS
jgi:succinyl-diaminopimelate desuccinylase